MFVLYFKSYVNSTLWSEWRTLGPNNLSKRKLFSYIWIRVELKALEKYKTFTPDGTRTTILQWSRMWLCQCIDWVLPTLLCEKKKLRTMTRENIRRTQFITKKYLILPIPDPLFTRLTNSSVTLAWSPRARRWTRKISHFTADWFRYLQKQRNILSYTNISGILSWTWLDIWKASF